MKKQRSASPSQAMPRSAPLERTRSMISRRFSSSSGFGSWSGNSPSGSKYISSRSSGELLEDRPDHRPGHPVAAVDDDLHRPHLRRVDEGERVLAELVPDVDLLEASRRRAPWPRPASISALHVADPGVAGERQGALADQLHPGVGLRVVRGGDHRAAVELARADQVVEHLGRDHAGVEDGRALDDHPVAELGRHRRRGQPHVAPEPDPQLARLLVAQARRARGRRRGRSRSAVVSSISLP